MDDLLVGFVNTLDLAFKRVQTEAGAAEGMARLTISQLAYVDAIHALGRPTVTDLARRLGVTKASATTGLNRLAALGYVMKTQSEADRRVWHAQLTPAGDRLMAAKHKALREYGAFVEAALTPTEARQLQKILTKLVKRFDQLAARA